MKKLVRKILVFAAAFLLCIQFVACVTLNPEYSVIERSKETQPTWAIKSGEIVAAGQIAYSMVNEGLKDLPLGVKETQLKALQNTKQIFVQKIQNQVLTIAANNQIPIQNNTVLIGHVKSTVESFYDRFATVNDMYFEKRKYGTGQPDDFLVAVRVNFPQEAMPQIFGALSRTLEKTRLQDLGKLSRALAIPAQNANPSDFVGH